MAGGKVKQGEINISGIKKRASNTVNERSMSNKNLANRNRCYIDEA